MERLHEGNQHRSLPLYPALFLYGEGTRIEHGLT